MIHEFTIGGKRVSGFVKWKSHNNRPWFIVDFGQNASSSIMTEFAKLVSDACGYVFIARINKHMPSSTAGTFWARKKTTIDHMEESIV